MTSSRLALNFALWFGGPTIWASHFLMLYAAESLFCSRLSGRGQMIFSVSVSLVALSCIGALIAITSRLFKPRTRNPDDEGFAFMDRMGFALAVLSLGGIALTTAALLTSDACAPHRTDSGFTLANFS